MAQPERYEDEEPETPAGPQSFAKPDWLVGAHEALESEFARPEDQPDEAPPDLRSVVPLPPQRPAGPRPINPYEGFAQPAAGRASSNWVETGYTAPDARPAGHPEAADLPEPEADETTGEGEELAGPETPTAAGERARWSPPAPPRKAWWEAILERALTPAGLIVAGVAVVVTVAASLLFGPKDHSIPLAKIRHNAREFDGQAVTVRGKVGEVYPVGGGYSFYLLQGRDTIVVFTRSRTPVSNERVSVSGVISTGVLNGELRQALLENSH